MVLGSNKDKWLHPEESIINGKVVYHVKFIGVTEVEDPRGMNVVRQAMQKLKFSRHIKRSEGTKPPKVDLAINVDGLQVIDSRTKDTLHDIPLQRVSFCADDKQDKRLFSFIAKGSDGKQYCYGFDSLHEANSITLTIGQAFELAYDKFLKSDKATTSKQVIELSKRIEQLERENSGLKQRIQELETSQQQHPLFVPLSPSFRLQTPPTSAKKDVFDMQPFTPPPNTPTLVRLPSPNEVFPLKSPSRRSPMKTKDIFDQHPLDITNAVNQQTANQDPFLNKPAFNTTPYSLDLFDPLRSPQ